MPANEQSVCATPERISELALQLQTGIRSAVDKIERVNLQTRLLAFNAQIEAARAGEAGRPFGVVSKELVGLADATQATATGISTDTQSLAAELAKISRALATSVRGVRLADLAHTNIELIDRNLYERSCDCRWWATDAAAVGLLEHPQEAALVEQAQKRLRVILEAYTVYFDIVVADLSGRIVANGRPDLFRSRGADHAQSRWFLAALETPNGNSFGFESVHASPLVGGQRVLVYSCRVCRGGDATGDTLGVLGVVFRWDALAQSIVDATPIEESARSRTCVYLLDAARAVLAAAGPVSGEAAPLFADEAAVFGAKKGSVETKVGEKAALVAHAASPGYETYRTGWYSVIVEYAG